MSHSEVIKKIKKICDLPRFCPSFIVYLQASVTLFLETKGINSAGRCSMCCKRPGDCLGGLLEPCSDLENTHAKASSGTGRTRLAGGRPPDSKMASAAASRSQDGGPQPRLRTQVSSPPPSRAGVGGASPVAVHRLSSTVVAVAAVPCRAPCVSSAGGKYCCGFWAFRPTAWRVSAGPAGEGGCVGATRCSSLGSGAGRCGAAGAGGPASLSGGNIWCWPRHTLIVAVAIRIPEPCVMPASWCPVPVSPATGAGRQLLLIPSSDLLDDMPRLTGDKQFACSHFLVKTRA